MHCLHSSAATSHNLANAARHHRPQHCAAPHRRRHHSQRWQQPPAAASSPNNQQETPEDTSALGQPYLSGPYLRSGPQNSIHTAAQQELEQYQQQQRLQQQQKQELAGWTAAEIAAANQETTSTNRMDVYKAIGLSASVCVLAGILDHDWIEQHQGLSMSLLFCLAYLGIFVEEVVGLNKAAVALVLAVSLWTIHSNGAGQPIDAEITAALASVSELIFFLLGAMTIVEVVDSHGGFKRLAAWVRADQRSTLAWIVALATYLCSSILDNLTTTIVFLGILQRAVPDDREFRKLLGAVVVVAANAGGAFCVIGDLTTTMLWVHGQLSPWPTFTSLLLPSFVSLAVPVAAMCYTCPEFQGPVTRTDSSRPVQGAAQQQSQPVPPLPAAAGGNAGTDLQLEVLNRDVLVLITGLGALLFVPVFEHLTSLPPWMGMLSGLGFLWLVTDALHFGESKAYPKVQDALRNVDISGVMFFLGILLSVEALNAAGLLELLAVDLNKVADTNVIAVAIGLASAVIDNVPLVAATMGMYDLAQVPQDSQLWQLIALCAGTGGSLLVIGSAAGVAYMGLEGVGFGWYFRRVTPWALLGYAAANLCYIGLHGLPQGMLGGG